MWAHGTFKFWPGKLKGGKICLILILFQRQESSYEWWALPFIRVHFWVLGGSEICPVLYSILAKCFTFFIQCHSSAWHVWSLHCCSRSPRAALPAALVCSTAFTTLCQETNFFHYCPTCHPIGLISSIPRYSQFYTCLFAIHRPDSYYSSTWAQVHFRHSLWDCLRSATPNVLNACTAAAFWIPSHEQGAHCARYCTRMIHTYKSVLLINASAWPLETREVLATQ